MSLTPSCAEDFTRQWVLFIMQQYYENNFSESIKEIGRFSAERADGEGDKVIVEGDGTRTAIKTNKEPEDKGMYCADMTQTMVVKFFSLEL